MNKVKVLVVDDHLMVREGLRQMLETDNKIKVIGEAGNGSECLRLLEKGLSPDIILMDIKMDGISGIEATHVISSKYPIIKVIILTVYKDDQYVSEAIEAGARGYIFKNIMRDQLLSVIHNVMQGHAYLDTNITGSLLNHVRKKKNITTSKINFTQRELEIMENMAVGTTDRNIAVILNISEHTVKTHIKHIYTKLGVSTRAHAVSKIIKEGIVF
jgi:DNA-binding NarL/FixJ family response regulator